MTAHVPAQLRDLLLGLSKCMFVKEVWVMVKLPYAVLMLLAIVSNVFADATIPTEDKPGSKDNPLLKRYDGSFIVGYEHKAFGRIHVSAFQA
jgi:hypothetical protein